MASPPPDSVGSVPPVIDFSRLWQTGQIRCVEDYLAQRYPDGLHVEALLDLIQQEVLLREVGGESPDPEGYQRRFPAHADQVGALFALNRLFATPEDGDPSCPTVPGYEVGERLGRGGTGEVFRATDDVLGRPIAVKVLRRELRDDPSSVGRFWGEARITARLQHPGVAPLYEAGYDERDRPFIAMKLVEGQTLARLLADRTSPADDLARLVHVFEQVCQTVAYAHSKGVIHRDLKPSNVMVGAFGEVQVMDWGLAKQLACATATTAPVADPPRVGLDGSTAPQGGHTLAGQMIGTPAYAPPEQVRGDHDRVGPASDVFGLGAVLCEILTGRPPFDSAEQASIGDVAPARTRLRASAADAELVDLAVRCLAPDPADRPADAGAVAAAIDGYQSRLRDRLREVELAEASSTSERKARRRTELLRLICVALVVAVGVGAWAWSQWQADLARDVTAAVEEGRSAREEMVRAGGDPARLAEAERAARRAEGLLRSVVGRADLRGSVAGLLADLEADARDPAMVRRLEEIRMMQDTSSRESTAGALDTEFETAFRDYGVDVTALDPDEAAQRLNRRASRYTLVAALDYWGQQCLSHPPLEPRGRHLLAVAAATDPDPWRTRLRTALLARDTDSLAALAREALAADLPIPTLVALGAVVSNHAVRQSKGATVTYPHRPQGIALLQTARRRTPGDFWANYLLADALQRSKRSAEAVPYYTVALALRPDLLGVRRGLAMAHLAVGDLPAVLRVYQEAVAAFPHDSAAHRYLGQFLHVQGETSQAAYHFEEALRLDPTSTEALTWIPRAWESIGAWDEALAALERVQGTRPPNPFRLASYATGLKHVGRFDDAVTALRQAHRLRNESPWTGQRLRSAERDTALARRLPGLEDGTFRPADPATVWDCVRLCYYRRHDRTAVRLAEQAMGNDKGRAAAPKGSALLAHIYVAARASSAADLDATEQARYRGLALTWLRVEMARQRADATGSNTLKWMDARRTLRRWQQHRDLAPVRDTAVIATFTESERSSWTAFWNEVETLVRRIDAGSPDRRQQ